MPETSLHVELLNFTPEPSLTAATAGHICYAGVGISELKKKVSPDYAKKLIKSLIASGHESPLEHASFTFGIEGVSRALTHQLVRHRIASFSQQSQRYVKEGGFSFIVPPKIKADREAHKKFLEAIEFSRKAYEEMLKISPAEDARFLLPNACETRIIMTMNTRSLYNFFDRRCCTRAQWEIRALANKMLELCRNIAPDLFPYGAICERIGYCPERETCGKFPLKKDALKSGNA
ncbi:MAG TPA: FAD-dependent thymidylate synthase [archaeon]|nr:FAD-dependent thymidylate synthase [archaeon]